MSYTSPFCRPVCCVVNATQSRMLRCQRNSVPYVALLTQLSSVCCVVNATLFLTNPPRNLIQLKALSPTNSNLFIVMLPRSQDKKPPFGTSLHTGTTRLCQVAETVFLQINQWKSLFECGSHNCFLSGRDGRRNQHRSLPSSCQIFRHFRLNLHFC